MHLIVGLGNPGSAYEGTRHNIGFAVIDKLSRRHGIDVGRKRFSCLFGQGRIENQPVILAKPQTFMNLSGSAVRPICEYFNIPVEKLCILHDDMDVELGRIKIVARGGAGGHNGVSSIIEAFGHSDFSRVKIGVGRPPQERGAVDHVLHRFESDETEILENVLNDAAEAAECFISLGIANTQARFNRKGRNILRREEVERSCQD